MNSTDQFSEDFLNDYFTYNSAKSVEDFFGNKDEKVLGRISMNLHMLNQSAKKDELALRDDTYFWCPWSDTLSVFIELGFEPVLLRTFTSNRTQIIYYHPLGILATAEPETVYKRAQKRVVTVTGRTMMFYNWVPNDSHADPTETQEYLKYSHTWAQGVKLGALDITEAFRHKLALLNHYGQFLPEWKAIPYSMDLRNGKERYNEKDADMTFTEIIEGLPPHVVGLMGRTPATT